MCTVENADSPAIVNAIDALNEAPLPETEESNPLIKPSPLKSLWILKEERSDAVAVPDAVTVTAVKLTLAVGVTVKPASTTLLEF